ncbi:phosphate signaling complex protein PhoU [bacterium]|nr:phosphate signaling complex protein PhoU [bacterium]
MNTDRHIATAFDRDLEGVQALVLRMGGLVEAAISDAATALETRDEALAEQVRAGDAAIDALEEQVNAECIRLIALRAPAASDLRTVMTVMKIAASLERCGDYAKNLAKRSMVLSQMHTIEGAAGSIRRMARQVGLLLKDALDAFIARDVDLAQSVRLQDRDIDQMYTALFREFLTHMLEDPRNITACMHLHFIAKNIERVGDHATTIAEQVIYLATGKLPADPRPKSESVIAGDI